MQGEQPGATGSTSDVVISYTHLCHGGKGKTMENQSLFSRVKPSFRRETGLCSRRGKWSNKVELQLQASGLGKHCDKFQAFQRKQSIGSLNHRHKSHSSADSSALSCISRFSSLSVSISFFTLWSVSDIQKLFSPLQIWSLPHQLYLLAHRIV